MLAHQSPAPGSACMHVSSTLRCNLVPAKAGPFQALANELSKGYNQLGTSEVQGRSRCGLARHQLACTHSRVCCDWPCRWLLDTKTEQGRRAKVLLEFNRVAVEHPTDLKAFRWGQGQSRATADTAVGEQPGALYPTRGAVAVR
jgi:hypothetical protein